MKYRVYRPDGTSLMIEADSADCAVLDVALDDGYQAGDLRREADCLDKRAKIDAAKEAFAKAHGLRGASNSAVTRAWKRAGKPSA